MRLDNEKTVEYLALQSTVQLALQLGPEVSHTIYAVVPPVKMPGHINTKERSCIAKAVAGASMHSGIIRKPT